MASKAAADTGKAPRDFSYVRKSKDAQAPHAYVFLCRPGSKAAARRRAWHVVCGISLYSRSPRICM
jgi:hypothetical protein